MTRVLRAASDHIVGDRREFVDFHDALDLHERSVQKAEAWSNFVARQPPFP
jgi:hypothetical protein